MRASVVSSIALLIAAALIVCPTAATARRGPRAEDLSPAYSFESFVRDFNKPYSRGSAEWDRRAALFKASLAKVLAHNGAETKPSYVMGINRMADWTEAEFRGIRGARLSPDYQSPNERAYVKSGEAPPPSVDWRARNPAVLTAVKDQGMCGDCWAHAVTEAVESAYARATGNLYVLSQQQVTSCTPRVGNCEGCDGFYPKYAYDFIAGGDKSEDAASQGLVEEWVYPFTSWSGDSGRCNASRTRMGKPGGLTTTVKISGFTQVSTNDQEAVMDALATHGPLSILVDALQWQHYESGVFTGCQPYAPSFALDHAVMLVGYGHDAATDLDYWIVRNSWSAAWGEHGFVRIARTAKPTCGSTYTLSCLNQTHNKPACGPCGLLTDAQFPNVVVPTRRQL